MADYYVRPKTWTPAGAEDGTSYATAWSGFDAPIVWASLGAGDTLWVCGTHKEERLTIAAGGAAGNPLMIRGDTDEAPDSGANGDYGVLTTSRQVGTWLPATGNEWYWVDAEADNEWVAYNAVVMTKDGLPINKAGTVGSLAAGYWQYDSGNIYYHAPDGNQPTGTYFVGGGQSAINWANGAYDYVTLKGLTLSYLQNVMETNIATPLTGIVLDDCTFEYGLQIFLSGCISPIVQNCTFNYWLSTILVFGFHSATTNPLVKNCTFYRGLYNDTDTNTEGHAIDLREAYAGPLATDSRGLTVEDCYFTENHWFGGLPLDGTELGNTGACLVSGDGTDEFTVRRNLFLNNYINCSQYGVVNNYPTSSGCYIYSNVCINNRNTVNTSTLTADWGEPQAQTAITITNATSGGTFNPAPVLDCYIYNNLFIGNGVPITDSDHGAVIRIGPAASDMSGVYIANNIFYNNVANKDISFGMSSATGNDGFTIRNNIHYREGATIYDGDYLFISKFGNIANPYPVTNPLSEWVSYTGEIQSIHEEDPSLDNNYAPQGDSPCIGAGIQPLSLTDHNGDTRKSLAGFDIGAVWFDGPSDTTVERLLASGGTK